MLKKKVLYENAKSAQNQLRALRSKFPKTDKLMWGIIPAAGKGLRFGNSTPKQYQTICNETVLKKSITALSSMPTNANLFVALVILAEDDVDFEKLKIEKQMINDQSINMGIIVLKAGKETRKKTVLEGLKLIDGIAGENDWVLVHDAARPGLSKKSLERLWNEVKE